MPRQTGNSSRNANLSENPLGESSLHSSSYEEPDTEANETRNTPRPKTNPGPQFRNRSSHSVQDMELTRGAVNTRASSGPNRSDDRTRGVRKPVPQRRKLMPGMKALKEIRKYQNNTRLLIPKLPFSRVVRETLQQYGPADVRVTAQALSALQEAAEIYITQFFEDSLRLALHAKRVTLMPRDMDLVRFLRGQWDRL
ncbi:uncharacterized protein LOC134838288 [Culicoides brevitarsis]|uniref:uncharacterized protein LOC134838288 n=1 Tax=Culicoides brevitarsis TaxID=469753 RepID=UPI00307C0ACE